MTYGAADKPVVFNAITKNGWFELAVANSGDPIPPDVLANLFEPFYRGDISHSREGLGLGLYICYEIAQSHGGELKVCSTANETRFTFRMPVSIKPEQMP
jgi:sigma-B regulation protein RsbU (phosphoserine phosphatase)